MNKINHIKSPLKWPGNKGQLLTHITPKLDPHGTRLVEPFVGSGAVFLNTTIYKEYLLADTNPHLITFFNAVKHHGPAVIAAARTYFQPHTNTRAFYHQALQQFHTATDDIETAALFLYLNRHGYNGLCRFNRKGFFNVPFGRYKAPYFPEAELKHLHTHSQNATFIVADFRQTLALTQAGDTIYADPPYAGEGFTAYDGNRFTPADQADLTHRLHGLATQKGITSVLSNHPTPATLHACTQAGAILTHLTARRRISCHASTRTPVAEILATYRP